MASLGCRLHARRRRRPPAAARWRAVLLAVLGAVMLHAVPGAAGVARAAGLLCPEAPATTSRGTKEPKSSALEPAAALVPQTLADGDPPRCTGPAIPEVFPPALPRELRAHCPPRAPPEGAAPVYLLTLRLRI
ncbi:MAG TPA: hypothetical protein VFV10_03650 [Gammaproteobacteria bacterium]|nr:hypothetical protein [Gammaproteobacteria bacterium]